MTGSNEEYTWFVVNWLIYAEAFVMPCNWIHFSDATKENITASQEENIIKR